ncbi:MAG: hypothetical protein ABRQ37_13950 [Candidatus Eremiobacterota bacterium]
MNDCVILRKMILLPVMVIIICTCGCGFDVYKKTNYVSSVTSVIKMQQDQVDSYITLTTDVSEKKISGEEAKKAFEKSRDSLLQSKKDLEAITPPGDYADEHQNFVKGFQLSVEAVEGSMALLDIKDDKEKNKKIEEVKGKIVEYRKLIKLGINSISVDLR